MRILMFITLMLLSFSTKEVASSNPLIIPTMINTVHELPEVLVKTTRYHPVESIELVKTTTVDECAEHYEIYFEYIADSIQFHNAKAFVAGYFGLETGNGSSSLWLRAMNPSGIVSTKNNPHQGGTTYSSDDGGSIKGTYVTMRKSADSWIYVFNQKRYERCAKMVRIKDQCKCMMEQGYHTSPRWWSRVTAIKNYEIAFAKLKILRDFESRNLPQANVYPHGRELGFTQTFFRLPR